jgi:hypothetical protein
VPEKKYMARPVIPMMPRVLTAGCKTRKRLTAPSMIRKGIKVFALCFKEVRFASHAARYTMNAGFKSSEGWNEKDPKDIHLKASPDLMPRPGINTNPTRTTAPMSRRRLHFFKKDKGRRTSKHPIVMPGSSPKRSWWVKK